MLAADRSLLEVNLKQSAIKLREKELNLYTENFSAMATQAAVLAGFTTTCLIELNIPENSHPVPKAFLHMSAIFSICSNIACVSLSTITTIWGSGKALRGKDGSMDEAVEGINDERDLIFRAFACGLGGNLSTVLFACILIMDYPVMLCAATAVLYTAWLIYTNAYRIQKKFFVGEAVRLDDLTKYPTQLYLDPTSSRSAESNASISPLITSNQNVGRRAKNVMDMA
eukprot:gene1677-1831_t